MLGVYDYTVILTYISLMVSIGGMLFSLNGDCRMALVCLAISGLCDMFDGKVARTKKDLQRLKNDLESRSILWRILSALEFHRQSFATAWECVD